MGRGLVWLGCFVMVGVAVGQQAAPAPDREALKQVTPNISGQRNGGVH